MTFKFVKNLTGAMKTQQYITVDAWAGVRRKESWAVPGAGGGWIGGWVNELDEILWRNSTFVC